MTDTRVQFEAHFQLSQIRAMRDARTGDYIDPIARALWEGWQAAHGIAAKDAARYRWLKRKVSAHGVIDGWAFAFPTHLTLPAPELAMTNPAAALDTAIDAAQQKRA